MSNTSATGGYLIPATSPAPLEGQTFEDFLQAIVAGVTGLAGQFVRPRWEAEPADVPDFDVDWAAIGVTAYRPDTFSYEQQDPDGDGSTELKRTEEVEILLSFYGPSADTYCALFRDGIQIEQNRAVLTSAGCGHISTGDGRLAPDLVKDRWRRRMDLTWNVRRQIRRVYPVLNVLSVNGTIYTDTTPAQAVPVEVTEP